MAVTCDKCGSGKDVQRAAVTVWNGNVYDLCKVCFKPLVKLLDKIHFSQPR